MRDKLFYPLALIMVTTLALAASSTNAQTTAAGPYYSTPSWDQQLACPSSSNCPRFIVLSNWVDTDFPSGGAAVLDRETGLVWERAPMLHLMNPAPWSFPRTVCAAIRVGGRLGWRLPSMNELASLVDPSVNFPGPTLPAGHPFTNVLQGFYWSATTLTEDPGRAWAVGFHNAEVFHLDKVGSQSFWCVHGGGVLDNY